MADIKTRDAVKGTIKTIDKSAVAVERMKDAFIRTRDTTSESSPEEYAAERVSAGAKSSAYGAARTLDKRGKNAVQDTRENIEKAKDALAQRKAAQPQEAAKKSAEKAQKTARRPSISMSTPQPSPAGARIKTADRQHMSIRTRERTRAAIKQPVRTVKSSARSIKTSEQVSRSAQISAKATAKTTARTAQAMRAAAKTTAEAAKHAAEAAVKAIKAIIAGTKALVEAIVAGGWIAVLIILIVVLLGAAFSLFGGSSGSSSYTPVSAAVEAYDPIILQYATQYGIGEYVELIKAVMMQESGGQGNDPMQASECGYNTRFPREPNGITDPEYSIDVGVQELAACLRLARVENPVDMEHIRLALQGYNYGEGYISWAQTNYGGYSVVSAMEYSTMMAEQNGVESYGDQNYVNHVLQYYPFARAFLPGGGQALVEVARTQLGNEGGEIFWRWYGFDSRVEWCACFASWCADQCGLIESGAMPKFSYCDDGIAWFQAQGRWQSRAYTPQPGDYIFFDWDHNGSANHVGIVERCENGVVYTIEGNSSDKCAERHYSADHTSVMGYGIF